MFTHFMNFINRRYEKTYKISILIKFTDNRASGCSPVVRTCSQNWGHFGGSARSLVRSDWLLGPVQANRMGKKCDMCSVRIECGSSESKQVVAIGFPVLTCA